MIDAGIGHTHVAALFSTMGMPSLTFSTMKRHERVVGPIIERVAYRSCVEAAKLEKSLTRYLQK
jgi:hypothetical protein